jgi:hypothetical protein
MKEQNEQQPGLDTPNPTEETANVTQPAPTTSEPQPNDSEAKRKEENKKIEEQKQLEADLKAKAQKEAELLAAQQEKKQNKPASDKTDKKEEEGPEKSNEDPTASNAGVSGLVQGYMSAVHEAIKAGKDLREVGEKKVFPAIKDKYGKYGDAIQEKIHNMAKPVNDLIQKMTAPNDTKSVTQTMDQLPTTALPASETQQSTSNEAQNEKDKPNLTM